MISDYQKALDFLYGFANFEHKRIEQYSPENVSLDRPIKLLELLGNPQKTFPAVHIAGTKGKGSVSAMAAASLRAAGYRVGLYTSPHLQEFRDRIRILTPEDEDGRISEAQVVAGVERMKPAIEQVPGITWFELITALAFLHFGEQQIDVAVVEVGLGGRLDATNVLTPLVSVITSISYDHTYLLGDTLAEIAGEKAGIIKERVPVVSAPQESSALDKIEMVAQAHHSSLMVVGRDWSFQSALSSRQSAEKRGKQVIAVVPPSGSHLTAAPTTFELALVGHHQQENAVVALAALEIISEYFPQLTLEAVRTGLATVSWPGRLQTLHVGNGTPTLLVDCAHNVDSAQKLAFALQNDYRYERLWLVLGVTADKDVSGIVETLLPLAEGTIVTTSGHPRAASPRDLLQITAEAGFEAQPAATVPEAVEAAWAYASPDDLICVTGSIFVVGDLLNQWDGLQSQLNLKPLGLEQ
ncbi:MAG: folylpolyglutamate synthase/dihydrofolate synthase family protein [Candidatus Promineifilaceae bacterium]